MKNRSLILLCTIIFLAVSLQAQQTIQINPRVEALKLKDLKRTARRYRISVDQLTNARTALSEATDLALRQETLTPDISNLARLWVQLDRKKAREEIANLISEVCGRAQSAKDLASYRQSTSVGLQLVTALAEIDPEKARKLGELWPEPSSSLGEAGRQALTQFQNDVGSRMMNSMMGSIVPPQNVEPYLDPRKSASLPFMSRMTLANSLIGSNQRDKARAVLDQGIADLGRLTPEPGKTGEYEMFVRNLASIYPERVIDAFDAYRGALARDNQNPAMIYELNDEKVLLSPSDALAVSMARNLYGRPELALKLVDSQPGLRAKLNQLGGIDRVLSPSSLSGNAMVRSYPANSPPPPPVNPAAASGGTDAGSGPATKPVDAGELYRSVSGIAEFDPERARRKLADACYKKEHFNILLNIAQMAAINDPDLSYVAVEVARGLLPLFDTPQSQVSSLRTLVSTQRQLDGEVEADLLRQGFNLVNVLREDEKQREQANPNPGNTVFHQSDDLEIYLIGQTAIDDFKEALRRARAIESENVRLRALVQMAQSMMSSY